MNSIVEAEIKLISEREERVEEVDGEKKEMNEVNREGKEMDVVDGIKDDMLEMMVSMSDFEREEHGAKTEERGAKTTFFRKKWKKLVMSV